MQQYDPRVDDFIEKAQPFAKPILKHIRTLVHEASPLVSEAIKWNCPFFEYKGTVCMMNAFKEHCSFGFWNSAALNDTHGVIRRGEEKDSAGSFGRLTSVADLPADDIIKNFVLQAIAQNETGKKKVVKRPTPEQKVVIVPDYFEDLLKEHPKANETFYNFSYSHKKEYIQWITEAKTEPTRQKRISTTIEQLEEGKFMMWKYSK
jgi:uncharacterized protein YdeI (YjbR/CyaY-like superfamily)